MLPASFITSFDDSAWRKSPKNFSRSSWMNCRIAAYSSRSRRASTATWMVGFGIGVMVYLRFSARLILRSCLSISLVGFLPEPEAARMLSYSPRLDMEPSARLIILAFMDYLMTLRWVEDRVPRSLFARTLAPREDAAGSGAILTPPLHLGSASAIDKIEFGINFPFPAGFVFGDDCIFLAMLTDSIVALYKL